MELFETLEKPDILNLSKIQNFIPIYNKFFHLNKSNYNNINLNHNQYISKTFSRIGNENSRIYSCEIKNIQKTNKTKEKQVFFKLAPLLDIYKYLVGKYNTTNELLNKNLFNLPQLTSTEDDCNDKLLDLNNSAYVDSFFVYLTSNLLENYKFLHGLYFYGSFLGIKKNYIVNVYDDLDYLHSSPFFNKNKNILFKIDNYEHLFKDDTKLKPIKIDYNNTSKTNISIKSIKNDEFEDIFIDNNSNKEDIEFKELTIEDLNNLTNLTKDNISTLKSGSTCSSRTSITSIDENIICENEDDEDNSKENGENDINEIQSTNDNDNDNDKEEIWEDEEDDEDDDDDDDESSEEEEINVYINEFPIQVICMENCDNTFDHLVINNDLTEGEWVSAFFQIIMILITYQKAFSFTHNDLHLNNIMYNQTNKKYLIYKYENKIYKVPTFGRLFKIIDFGRSIYKYNGELFCSDSFKNGNDAATQYNFEPYFNENKPRLNPNYSFDLCRLACSIFDYLIEDFEETKDLSKIKDPIKKLVIEWCLDDKGINLLYKSTGVDRYPEFKLYKMIARHVHNHTPQAQLERPLFKQLIVKKITEKETIDIDIDIIPHL
jgi:hypothetical protein